MLRSGFQKKALHTEILRRPGVASRQTKRHGKIITSGLFLDQETGIFFQPNIKFSIHASPSGVTSQLLVEFICKLDPHNA